MAWLGNPDRPVGGLSVATPSGVELRPLARNDFAVALALIGELYDLPDADPEPLRPRFEALVNDPDAVPFLALDAEAAVGIVIFRFRRRVGRATYEGWVSDLYVRGRSRGRGIGRALLRACIEEWRLRRGHRLTLEVGFDNLVAQGLYESVGLVESGRHLQLRPIPVPPARRAAELVVRRADGADAEVVLRLAEVAEDGGGSEERTAAVERTYRELAARPDSAAWVALQDQGVVGFLRLVLRQPFFVPRPQAWIAELWVVPGEVAARAAEGLLGAALRKAADNDAYAVVLETLVPGDASAAALGLGFQNVGIAYALDR